MASQSPPIMTYKPGCSTSQDSTEWSATQVYWGVSLQTTTHRTNLNMRLLLKEENTKLYRAKIRKAQPSSWDVLEATQWPQQIFFFRLAVSHVCIKSELCFCRVGTRPIAFHEFNKHSRTDLHHPSATAAAAVQIPRRNESCVAVQGQTLGRSVGGSFEKGRGNRHFFSLVFIPLLSPLGHVISLFPNWVNFYSVCVYPSPRS